MQAMLGYRGFKYVSETADGFNMLRRDVPEPTASTYQHIYLPLPVGLGADSRNIIKYPVFLPCLNTAGFAGLEFPAA